MNFGWSASQGCPSRLANITLQSSQMTVFYKEPSEAAANAYSTDTPGPRQPTQYTCFSPLSGVSQWPPQQRLRAAGHSLDVGSLSNQPAWGDSKIKQKNFFTDHVKGQKLWSQRQIQMRCVTLAVSDLTRPAAQGWLQIRYWELKRYWE